MTPDLAAELVSRTLRLTLSLATIVLVPSLVVGLLISLFQSATQINEQTLSFLPRLVATLLVIGIAGPFIEQRLMDFCVEVFQRAALLVS